MALGLLNGSVLKFVNALSPVAIAAAGSSNSVNLAGYEGAIVVVSCGSAPSLSSGGLLVTVLRSATSNGTFQGMAGASIAGIGTNNQTAVRSFAINTSATWHRIFYNNSNGGSTISNIELIAFNTRYEPVQTQETNVTVYSDSLRA